MDVSLEDHFAGEIGQGIEENWGLQVAMMADIAKIVSIINLTVQYMRRHFSTYFRKKGLKAL